MRTSRTTDRRRKVTKNRLYMGISTNYLIVTRRARLNGISNFQLSVVDSATKLAICDRKLAGFASQLFRRKKGIHGAGAETLQIKRNELEAQGFERSGECGSHSGI